jgi:hypothetical protein
MQEAFKEASWAWCKGEAKSCGKHLKINPLTSEPTNGKVRTWKQTSDSIRLMQSTKDILGSVLAENYIARENQQLVAASVGSTAWIMPTDPIPLISAPSILTNKIIV